VYRGEEALEEEERQLTLDIEKLCLTTIQRRFLHILIKNHFKIQHFVPKWIFFFVEIYFENDIF